MIGMNYEYPDGNYATRERIQRTCRLYKRTALFLTHDERVPSKLRDQVSRFDGRKMNLLTMITFRPNHVREASDA